MSTYRLETRGLSKIFPGVVALNNVSIGFGSGEVHGIVGENGAGKSTLIMTLAGQYKPDEGEIRIDGEKIVFKNAQEAQANGISVVFQELSLVPNLGIAENIFANNQPMTKLGMVDWKKLWKMGEELLQSLQLDLNPHTPVQMLSSAKQQLVEILKAVSLKPRVLVLDEPTSSMTEFEIEKLFSLIRQLKDEGCTIIYISHHLKEILTLCDTVSILKDGCHVCDAKVEDIDENFLISKMVGRTVDNIYGVRHSGRIVPDEPILRLENLSCMGKFHNVNLNVYEGQITTLSGLVGSGRTEVCQCIFGLEQPFEGKIYYQGKERIIKNPQDAITLGISYMTEDRKNEGLYLHESIAFNLSANRLRTLSKFGFIREADNQKLAENIIKKYNVSCRGPQQAVETLSGGNQQKVMLAEWVEIMPKLLIVDEPTRGIDVGAKSEIYNNLHALANQGMAILVVSSDLLEVLNISDKIVVMNTGTVAGVLDAAEATEESVLRLSAGTLQANQQKVGVI